MKLKKVAVVIPIYRKEPPQLEKITLKQTLKVFSSYPIIFQTSRGLDTTWYTEFCSGQVSIEFREFNFCTFVEYNNLLNDPLFFSAFEDYEYIMVSQLDAFPFRDELLNWCAAGYDIVGGVIYGKQWEWQVALTSRLLGLRTPSYYFNGGFVLYKISTMIEVLTHLPFSVRLFKELHRIRRKGIYPLNDIMLAQIQHHFPDKLKIPSKSVAARFGVNLEDDYDVRDLPFTNKNMDSLPFGVHGWFRWQMEFWKPCIEACGYRCNQEDNKSSLIGSLNAK